jgi:carboxyl-terminal processing protease
MIDMRQKLRNLSLVSVGVVAGVCISLGITATAQRENRQPLPLEELRQFTEVFGAIKSNYVESVEDKKLITEAISGMLSGLDPHSTYLDADGYKDLQVGTQGEFGGLGIEVGTEEGFVKVVSPIEDTPAAKAGVKAGDLIIKLDEKPTKGMTLNDAVKIMRGKPKTGITLTIMRKGEGKPVVITIIRDVIKVQSVKSKMLETGIGYIRITQFQEHTTENVVKAFNNLSKDQALKGLVLDLRNDPGGLLNSAVGVSAAFLPSKTLVVSTDGRTEDAKRKFYAAPEDYSRGGREDHLAKLSETAKNVPMVVLVNGGSASASEIVAGALQDHKRASIMGTQTFGKGSVQTILPLTNNTAIKLTTARYYTPSGRTIQAKGIEPDLLVEETPEGDVSNHVREADLNKHLSNDKDKDGEIKSKVGAKADKKADEAKDRKPIEFGSADDYQLQQALNKIKGLPVQLAKAKVDDKAAANDAAKAEKGDKSDKADKKPAK